MTEIKWEPDAVAGYVSCYYGPEGHDPGDCYTRVGEESGEWWVDDGDDVVRADTYGPFASRELAVAQAAELARAQDESELGEDAEAMQRRVLLATAGDPDPEGEYCVYWSTTCDDAHVVDRRVSAAAAEAAAALANAALAALHPGGRLLCGYEVRVLRDGDWAPIDDY